MYPSLHTNPYGHCFNFLPLLIEELIPGFCAWLNTVPDTVESGGSLSVTHLPPERAEHDRPYKVLQGSQRGTK